MFTSLNQFWRTGRDNIFFLHHHNFQFALKPVLTSTHCHTLIYKRQPLEKYNSLCFPNILQFHHVCFQSVEDITPSHKKPTLCNSHPGDTILNHGLKLDIRLEYPQHFTTYKKDTRLNMDSWMVER